MSWRNLFKVKTLGISPRLPGRPVLPSLQQEHRLSYPKWPEEGSLDFLVFYRNWEKALAFAWTGMGWFVT